MMDEEYGSAPNTAGDQAPDSPEDEGQETALIPKSLFGENCKVGDTYTVKVTDVLEDELAIEPVKESTEEKSEMPGKSRMEMAGDKLDGMMAEA